MNNKGLLFVATSGLIIILILITAATHKTRDQYVNLTWCESVLNDSLVVTLKDNTFLKINKTF